VKRSTSAASRSIGVSKQARRRESPSLTMTARRTVPRARLRAAGLAYRRPMIHVYVLTDDTGSWPLLTFHELPWQALRTPPLTLLPLGTFVLLDHALACAADFGASTRGRLVEEALDGPHVVPTSVHLGTPRSSPTTD
jgi:hypothetical protein